jgi:FKBP-type peptidyl-prolyl cis-trans isomerase FkpA
MKHLLFLFVGLVLMTSCSKEDSDTIFNRDIEQIEKYIKDNNLTAEKTVHGVYYVIENPGGAEKPTLLNTVILNYKGYLLDSREFDSANKAEIKVFQQVEGFQIGIQKFGKGGKGKILVPSRLGYGTSEVRENKLTIPGSSVLVYDVEVFDWNEVSGTGSSLESEQIEKYIKDNNLKAEKTTEGLYYVIDEPGGSDKPKLSSTVTINYRGYLLNLKEFDKGNNVSFPLNQLIEGWKIGIPKFGKGGKGKLLIPSRLGYGPNTVGSIPANSILIFDIELLDWK